MQCVCPYSAKASLTASRTAANAIYVTPLLQAEIDEMSGVLHCEETDYNTAYSYFLEAFDAYDQGHQKTAATSCLKYMILCKVLNNQSNDVPSLIASKLAAKHNGIDVEAMAAIAKAAKVHSLEDFQAAVGLSCRLCISIWLFI
jgi:26S proteasome regulatory subunit N6